MNTIYLHGVALDVSDLSAQGTRWVGKITIRFRDVEHVVTANFSGEALADFEGEDVAACEGAELYADDFATAIAEHFAVEPTHVIATQADVERYAAECWAE
jgi:hypothetical protein